MEKRYKIVDYPLSDDVQIVHNYIINNINQYYTKAVVRVTMTEDNEGVMSEQEVRDYINNPVNDWFSLS